MCQPSTRRLSQHEAGFTLIQWMIGVAIIGIVATMAAPNVESYRERERVAAAVASLGSVRAALAAYAADDAHTLYPPTAAIGTDYGQLAATLNPYGASLPPDPNATGIASIAYTATTAAATGAPAGSDYTLVITALAPEGVLGRTITVTAAGVPTVAK
jgi:type IV pilus assembly protein PilA